MHRFIPLLGLALATSSLHADITVEPSPAGAVVKIDGQLFTEYVTLSESKPILYPILGTGQRRMTRDYPMVMDSKNEKHDHIHHRSLWFTHMEVNGWNFWAEKGTYGEGAKKREEGLAKLGMQKHRSFSKLEGGKESGTIISITDWIAGDGSKQLEDERRITISTQGESRVLDFDIDLKATEGDVVWGDNKDGTFGIRLPSTMDVDQKELKGEPGHILNSDGLEDDKAWGKAAQWVDYTGKVNGSMAGVAILNHPSSFRYPTTWHVRTYGLFCANPFGYQDFDKKAADGSHTQKKGETLKFSYRLIFHSGKEDVKAAFTRYAAEKK